MRTIILNSSNYVAGSGNKYVYVLPQSYKSSQNDAIGVASVSIYNSTFNITALRGNNTITIYWNANTQTSFTLIIPDGYYSATDLNYQIQQFCILNNLYCTNASGNYIYFCEVQQNAPRYALQLNLYYLPTAANATTLGYSKPSGASWSFPSGNYIYFIEIQQNAPRYSLQLNLYYLPTSANATTLGYSKPSGASWSFPSGNYCPQVVVSQGFGSLLGLSSGTYPSTSTTTSNQQFISTTTPVISPIDSYILTCNLINSPYTIPSNAFFTIPLNASLGQLVTVNPSQIVFNTIAPNVYSNITIMLYDQLFNPLVLNDKEMTLSLCLLESQDIKNSLGNI